MVSGHEMLANIVAPEMAISEVEGERLARAGGKVARWYINIALAQKAQDWIGLAGCLGALYLPRVRAIAARNKGQAAVKGQHVGPLPLSMQPPIVRPPPPPGPDGKPHPSPQPPPPPPIPPPPQVARNGAMGPKPAMPSMDDIVAASGPLLDPRRFTP